MRYYDQFGALLLFTLFSFPIFLHAQSNSDPVLKTLQDELDREYSVLKKQDVAPYFVSYNLGDEQNVTMVTSYGALQRSDSSRTRTLLVDLRVGDYMLDNTHQIRGGGGMFGGSGFAGANTRQAPIENNDKALKLVLWRETDAAYKAAKERFEQVKTNRNVKVEEEDTSADFSQPKGAPISL